MYVSRAILTVFDIYTGIDRTAFYSSLSQFRLYTLAWLVFLSLANLYGLVTMRARLASSPGYLRMYLCMYFESADKWGVSTF